MGMITCARLRLAMFTRQGMQCRLQICMLLTEEGLHSGVRVSVLLAWLSAVDRFPLEVPCLSVYERDRLHMLQAHSAAL